MISLIAAVAQNGVIGYRNAMPWNLPNDFRWFKEKTFGKQLIVGRKTFESIGKKPLPNRSHVILTTQRAYEIPSDCNCVLAHSIDQVLALTQENQETMVCGGGIVYQQFLPTADRMYLTYVHHDFEGDVFFPEFSPTQWSQINKRDYGPDEENVYAYSIITFQKTKTSLNYEMLSRYFLQILR